MKRKLFLLLCALLTMIGVQAQETPTNDGIYYLYNSETDLFLSRGNDWGTQAVANPVALPWKVSISDGNYTLRMYDLTVTGSTTGLGSNGFTDNGSPLQFTPSGNATDGFTLKNGNNYITCPASAGVVTLSTTASAWKFLTQAQYNDVLAARVAAQESAVAAAKGIVIPDGKTLNDVVSNPEEWAVDATVNDGVPTSEKWTATKHSGRGGNLNWGGYGSEMYQCGDGHYTRTISGLKKGIYKVAIRGMKRMGSNATCTTMGNAGYPVSDSYLTANGNVIRFKAWYEDRVSDSNPNSTGDFVSIVNNGGYTTEGFVYVGDDGKLVLDASSEAFWGGCWFLFNGISYTFYNNEVSPEDATTIIAQADDLLTKEMDATIKSTLLSARNTFDAARTIANYNALNTAISAAQTSADAYAAFAPERTKAIALGMDPAVVETYVPDVNALKVAEYNYVTTTYPYAVSLGEWTKVNATDRSGQHWDNTAASKYSEQNEGWGANSWSCSYNQNVTLPSGKYVFKVAGRKSSNSATLTLKVTNGNEIIGMVNDFPNGDTGKGIDTSGATNFGDGTFANNGAGRGWEWRYVKFTLNEDATVNVSITGDATAMYQWVGFCNATVQADNDDVVDILAYNVAKASAIAVRDNAQYAAVTGSERVALINTINADPTADYPAATAALNDASAAFIAAAPAYTAFAELNSNVATKLGVALPTITSETVAADLDVNGIIVAEYTAAKSYGTVLTSKLGDWTNAPGTNKGQSWDGTTGDDADTYYDEYNGTDRAMTQTVTLPAGDYALIAKGRASANGLLTVVVGEETVTFPHKGASGYGIATNGDATFADNAIYANDGNGWGWEYRVITFTSDGATPITLTFNWKTASNNWCGLDDIELRINASSANLKVTDGKLGTFIAPFDITLPENVKAYSATVENNEVKLSRIAEGGDKLNAGTPVVVFGDGVSVDETFYGDAAVTENKTVGNLVGILNESEKTVPVDAYVLQTQTIAEQQVQAFYKVTTAAPGALNRCYVIAASPKARLVISFDGEDPTAINAIEAAEAEDGALKDGKYLIDGKVILVKNGVKYSANGQILK